MDGTLVAPDWPALTLEEIRPILREYLLPEDGIQILSTSPRPFSAASVIGMQEGQVFVKRHARSVRDAAGLTEEHRFIAHLRSKGVPVPEVLHTVAGSSSVETDGWTYEIHRVLAGVDLYADSLSWTPFMSADHAYSAGRMMAKVHRAAEAFKAQARKPQPLVASFTIFAGGSPDVNLDRYLVARPHLARYPALKECRREAMELLAPYYAELAPWLDQLPSFWTHSDLHGSNLFWSSSSDTAHAVAIIDFGLADRTNAVYDIAQAIDRSIVEWLVLSPAGVDSRAPVPVHLDHLDAMLTSYEEVRPLSQAEAYALAPMTALGHAEFALSEADYFYGSLHSEAKAAQACPLYLCGHARWFSTSEGRGFLDYLRAWAARHPLQR
jgi:Ser/Thr protein kinase RdoA (MazF antagonist)